MDNTSKIKYTEIPKENVKLQKVGNDMEDGSVHRAVYEKMGDRNRMYQNKRDGRRIIKILLITVAVILIVGGFYFNAVYSKNYIKLEFPKKDSVQVEARILDRQIELCQDTKLKRSFPDFDYALYGYNIIYGYPLATGHDPGLTRPIFKANYTGSKMTADCRYQVPKGYYMAPDVACVTSFTSEITKDSSQFSKELSVSASIEGGGWGVSFSASTEYKKKTSVMAASESVFIFSKASCNYYFSKLNEVRPPSLTEDFISSAKALKGEKDVFNFFQYYGTHFQKYTLFGARFIYEYKMSQKEFQNESSDSTSVSAKASYSGLFSLSGGFGMSSSNQQKAMNFQSKVETKTISIGAPPPANGDTLTWASTVKDTPIPVKYVLESIEELFTEKYMKGTGVDYEKVKSLMVKSKSSYCQYLKKKGVVNRCSSFNEKLTFPHFKLKSTNEKRYDQYSQGLCEERCQRDNGCFAIYYEQDSHSCWIHRAIQSKAYSIGEGSISENFNTTVLFFDALKLLNYSLMIEKVSIKVGIPERDSFHANYETECIIRCIDDQICGVVAFKSDVSDNENNCWLYNFDDVSCKASGLTGDQCKTIASDPETVTTVVWFHPDQKLKQALESYNGPINWQDFF